MTSRRKRNEVDWVSKAKRNPNNAVEQCRTAFRNNRKAYRTELRDMLAGGYAASVEFISGKGDWKKFCKNEFWMINKRARPKNRKEALYPVMFYIFGSNRYDRAYKYARGLALYLKEKVKPADVVAKLKAEHGIEALYRKAIAEDPRRKRKREDEGGEQTENESEEGASPKRMLKIEISKRRLKKLAKLKTGDTAQLTVEKQASTLAPFLATGVKPLAAKRG